jgi:CRP-like cAMP-binding protein
VLSGQLIRNKITDSSRRQIISFHVVGDLPNLHSLYLGRADHNITSLGSAVVGFISHSSLRELMARSPGVTQALWRETLVEASIFREWEINLGGREAIARVAHLLCEMAVRLRAVNLTKNLTFALPWTQHDIGDACGMSNVHVNRVIQTLRSNDVIDWRSKVMRIVRWEELERIAEFSPNYLHLPGNKKKLMELQEIQIASKYGRDARLVLMDGALIAVLVKLSDVHANSTGHWFLETGCGALRNKQPTFPDLQAANSNRMD